MRSRLAIFSLLLTIAAASRADTVDTLAETLNKADKTLYSMVLSIPEKEPALRAVRELEAIGSNKAVSVLAGYLRKTGGQPELKRQALATLGRIGSRNAIKAIADFETWAEARPKYLRDISLGLTDYPSHHVAPYEQSTLAELSSEDGTVWALFACDAYRPNELWIGKKNGDRLTDIVLLEIDVPKDNTLYELQKKGRIRIEAGTTATSFRVALGDSINEVDMDRMRIDSDHDGIPDVRERHATTDLEKSDSDGDGVSDDKDGNPLTVPATTVEDAALVRQAVFLLYFGLNESRNAIRTPDKTQEYRGYGGPVLWSSQSLQGCVNFTMEITQLDGNHAKVHYGDYEGNLAASGNTVELQKIRGRWVVTSFRLDVIA